MSAAVTPARLRECVERLAAAIDSGEVTPSADEIQPGGTLEVLALACAQAGLDREAARVRSWMRGAK
jgi:hypothetical protein